MNRVESSKFIMRMLKDENIFLRSRACSYWKLLQWNTSGRFIITLKFQFLRCLHETLSDKTNRFQPVAARISYLDFMMMMSYYIYSLTVSVIDGRMLGQECACCLFITVFTY